LTFAILPDPPDDLTPPAEWLLQSARAGGQVTSEILAEALAYEHHAWLRRLGAALLPPESEPLPGEPRQRAPIPPSERLLCETLTAALGKVHAYDAGLGVRPWLAALAVQAITRRIQRLPPVPQSDDNAATLAGLDLPVAAAAALRLLCGFSRAELARIPGLPEDWLAGLSAALLPGAANAGDEPDPFQSDAPRSERALDGSISAGDNLSLGTAQRRGSPAAHRRSARSRTRSA